MKRNLPSLQGTWSHSPLTLADIFIFSYGLRRDDGYYFREVVRTQGTCWGVFLFLKFGKVPKVRPTWSEGKTKLGSHLHAKTDTPNRCAGLWWGWKTTLTLCIRFVLPVEVYSKNVWPSLLFRLGMLSRSNPSMSFTNTPTAHLETAKEVEESYGFF